MKYSREIVAEVLAANDIADVIGQRLDLKPAGPGRLKALCPFHIEKTPSFTVNRPRQIFHCFGCGKGGDALAFMMEHDGLTFNEALRKLAERANIRLPMPTEEDARKDFQRTQAQDFCKYAARFYRELLAHPMRGSVGRQYLKTRDLKDTTIQRFGLGFAPAQGSELLEAAREKGVKDYVLEGSGLFKRSDGGRLYDFFRNRLIFPIKDIPGNTVAFGGRDLGDSPAKYINSPETSIYKKGRILYGLHEARDALRREPFVILVEGYFDLLRCFDAGVENVVATCGTALTAEQAALIRRYVSEVVIVYDGDAAGVKAALRGIGVLVGAGLTVRALALPDNQDPDDFIRAQGVEAIRELLRHAADFVTFYVRMSATRTTTIEGRTEVAQELFALLMDIEDEMRRPEYVKRIARELGLTEWACERAFSDFSRESRRPAPISARKAEAAAELKPVSLDDRRFIAALISSQAMLERVRTALAGITLPPGPVSELVGVLLTNAGPGVVQALESDEARRIYAAAATDDAPPLEQAQELVDRRSIAIKKESMRVVYAQMQRQIEEFQRRRELDKANALLLDSIKIKRQMETMGAT